jgi:hypothetical protein
MAATLPLSHDALEQDTRNSLAVWGEALPDARRRAGIRRPRGNKNALKLGRYTREAIAK